MNDDLINENIKELIINSKNKVYSTINTEMLNLYWNIGRKILELSKKGQELTQIVEDKRKKLCINQ